MEVTDPTGVQVTVPFTVEVKCATLTQTNLLPSYTIEVPSSTPATYAIVVNMASHASSTSMSSICPITYDVNIREVPNVIVGASLMTVIGSMVAVNS